MTAEQRQRLIAAFKAWGETEAGTVEEVCNRIASLLEHGEDQQAITLAEQLKATLTGLAS